ncbi:hypothetical protein D3C85_1488030 [compost metagenome]
MVWSFKLIVIGFPLESKNNSRLTKTETFTPLIYCFGLLTYSSSLGGSLTTCGTISISSPVTSSIIGVLSSSSSAIMVVKSVSSVIGFTRKGSPSKAGSAKLSVAFLKSKMVKYSLSNSSFIRVPRPTICLNLVIELILASNTITLQV